MATAANYPNRLAQPARPAPAPTREEIKLQILAEANLKERTEPRFVKLEEGEFFAGILTDIQRIRIKGKPANCYLAIDLDNDEAVKFNGTYNLDTKFRRTDVGHVFTMRCIGEQDTGQGQKMKMFEVKVSERTAPGWAEDGTPITDDDLSAFDR